MCCGSLEHKVSGQQAVGRQQQRQQVSRDRIGRARDDAKRTSGKPELTDVGPDHREPVGEARVQDRRSSRVELDRDHVCANRQEWCGQGAGSRTDVDDEVAGTDR